MRNQNIWERKKGPISFTRLVRRDMDCSAYSRASRPESLSILLSGFPTSHSASAQPHCIAMVWAQAWPGLQGDLVGSRSGHGAH